MSKFSGFLKSGDRQEICSDAIPSRQGKSNHRGLPGRVIGIGCIVGTDLAPRAQGEPGRGRCGEARPRHGDTGVRAARRCRAVVAGPRQKRRCPCGLGHCHRRAPFPWAAECCATRLRRSPPCPHHVSRSSMRRSWLSARRRAPCEECGRGHRYAGRRPGTAFPDLAGEPGPCRTGALARGTCQAFSPAPPARSNRRKTARLPGLQGRSSRQAGCRWRSPSGPMQSCAARRNATSIAPFPPGPRGIMGAPAHTPTPRPDRSPPA